VLQERRARRAAQKFYYGTLYRAPVRDTCSLSQDYFRPPARQWRPKNNKTPQKRPPQFVFNDAILEAHDSQSGRRSVSTADIERKKRQMTPVVCLCVCLAHVVRCRLDHTGELFGGRRRRWRAGAEYRVGACAAGRPTAPLGASRAGWPTTLGVCRAECERAIIMPACDTPSSCYLGARQANRWPDAAALVVVSAAAADAVCLDELASGERRFGQCGLGRPAVAPNSID
jgi:hypothetical protein